MAKEDINKWKYLNEEDVKLILLDQARQVETMLFQQEMYEPSKLENSAAYLDWQNKKQILSNQMERINKTINELGLKPDDLLKFMEEKQKNL